MTGIYRIYNIINGKSYIGQSKDIMNRFQEHFYHRTAKNASNIDKDINAFGIENFMFQILELCSPEELDFKEDFYIKQFNSISDGYNEISGGQHNIGESNSNAKISEYDVYCIREAYKNHINPTELYYNGNYASKISISYFFNLWEGKSWTNIHMDVYTDENKEYYKNLSKSLYPYKFSNYEVNHYRDRYKNETASQIYNSIPFICSYSAFKSMLSGTTYKNITEN